MRKLFSFLVRYRLILFVIVGVAVALVLQALGLHKAQHWVLGSVSLLGAVTFIARGWDSFRHGQYGIDVMAPITIITAIWIHAYWVAVIIMTVKIAGTMLAGYIEGLMDADIKATQQDIDLPAHVLRGSKTLDISASKVRAGDRLIVRTNETVPVDITPPTTLYEVRDSLLDDDEPVANDMIPSGSLNVGPDMAVRAVRSGEESRSQRLAAWSKSAYYSQAPFARLADRFSIPFAIVALVVGGVMWVVSKDVQRFLDVLVVATPYALITGPALIIRFGIHRASMQGIVMKNAAILERIADIDTLALDKNGVLAAGSPTIAHVTTFGRNTKNDVLSVAASLEQHSSHALAHAILSYADSEKVVYTKAKHVAEEPGRGLSARLKNQNVFVGNYAYLTENEISMPGGFKPASITQTACFVAIDGVLAGLITFDNPVRSSAKDTLEELRRLGVRETLLLTGDHMLVAKKLGKKLGFTNVEAELSTAGKLRVLESVEKRPLGYIGSPTTEPPLFTTADVGILLGAQGNGLADKTADVLLLSDNFNMVSRAMRTASRIINIAGQGIIVGAGLSLVLIGLFATGKIPAVIGASLQFLIVLLVLANTLRARHLSV